MMYRLSVWLGIFVLTGCGQCAEAQCSPTSGNCPPVYRMVYKSKIFYIPRWLGGAATRTFKDCKELNDKLSSEDGDGNVTRAYGEFLNELRWQCSRLNRTIDSEFRNDRGEFCITREWELWTPPDLTPLQLCQSYLEVISVKDTDRVSVFFRDLPCRGSVVQQTWCYDPVSGGFYSPAEL